MADRIVQLVDKNDDNIYPVTTVDGPTITVTSTDPGAGSSLASNHFIAVVGNGTATVGASDLASNSVTTAKIADNAVTTDKIDYNGIRSTFTYECGNTSNNNINNNTWYDQKTITLTQDGVYLIWFAQRMTNGGSGYDLSVDISLNGTEIMSGTSGGSSYVNYVQANVLAVFLGHTGDIVRCRSKGGGSGSYGTNNGKYLLVKLY